MISQCVDSHFKFKIKKLFFKIFFKIQKRKISKCIQKNKDLFLTFRMHVALLVPHMT